MTGSDASLAARARAWRDADPDPRTRAELDRLLAGLTDAVPDGQPDGLLDGQPDGQAGEGGGRAALAERFEGSLAFGTAGLRAEMGAGPLRMNRLVAGRVAAGLAHYLTAAGRAATDGRSGTGARSGAGGGGAGAGGVVIGYDGRANSRVFATDIARILSRAGLAVALLPEALPTPVLAFAVRRRRAAYGLMVTASHNPRQDNGIKVYVRDGGQLLPPEDAAIAAAIDATDPLRLPAGWAEGPFAFESADDVLAAYVTAVAPGGRRATPGRPWDDGPPGPPGDGRGQPLADGPGRPRVGVPELTVVHTALHGVGDATLRAVLAAAGWPPPVPVTAQQQPDPGFPTVPYPNPEAPGVLDLAQAAAEREGADLVLANDPDADRLAVMVPGPQGWRALTGDELGALLGDAVLARLTRADTAAERGAPAVGHSAPAARPGVPAAGYGVPAVEHREPAAGDGGRFPVVATTVVSGSLLRRLAEAAGVRCVTTLTGFKWIARAAGEDGTLVYGYEQALGYAVRPDLVADKDGISAALLVLELAAELARQGRTLADRLDGLALAHGLHVTRQRSLRAGGAAGLARLADAVARVRKEPPRLLAGQPVTVTDLHEGTAAGAAGAGRVVDLAGGRAERAPGLPVPPADVLIWHAGGNARVMIRPSGTEPELKIYAETVWPVRARAELPEVRARADAHVARLLAAAAAIVEANIRGEQT